MKKLFTAFLMAFVLLTFTPAMAEKKVTTEPQTIQKPQPVVVFDLAEGLEKLKSSSDCSYFSFYDCYIHYAVRWNNDTFSWEVYPDYADLIIYCSLTGTYHSVRLDLTSSIM